MIIGNRRTNQKSLVGEKLNMMLVLSESQDRGKGQARMWNIRCDCGYEGLRSTTDLHRTKSCGCLQKNKFKNLSNQIVNGIELIECIGQNNYKAYLYKAKCKCGKIFNVEGNDVTSGRLKSCGCRINYTPKLNYQDRKIAGCRAVYSMYKSVAKTKGRSFELIFNYFFNLVSNNCYYCDIPPSNTKRIRYNQDTFLYSGIDRIDNELGYIMGNVRPACSLCNQAKHTLTEKAFLELANKIVDNMKKKVIDND